MPTTYTHYSYGQEVLRLLPRKLQKQILPNIHYYNIGVHGPDILFYYRPFCKNAVNQYGLKMHNEPMNKFLTRAFSIYPGQKDKEAAFAYLAGFMTHFILDSACHPFVTECMETQGFTHAELEYDWDYIMMKRDQKNPVTYKAARHIRPAAVDTEVMAPYLDKTADQVRETLVEMKFVINEVLYSHFGIKNGILDVLEKILPFPLNFRHYIRKKKVNPYNIENCRELYRRYRKTRRLCAEQIVKFYEALQEGDDSFCENKRFEKTFM